MDGSVDVEALVRQELTQRIVELRQEIYQLKNEVREMRRRGLARDQETGPSPDYEPLMVELSWAENMEEVKEIHRKYRRMWRGEQL